MVQVPQTTTEVVKGLFQTALHDAIKYEFNGCDGFGIAGEIKWIL